MNYAEAIGRIRVIIDFHKKHGGKYYKPKEALKRIAEILSEREKDKTKS